MHAPHILSADDSGDFSVVLFVGNTTFWRPTISQEHALEKL